jgi:hypothetical protein
MTSKGGNRVAEAAKHFIGFSAGDAFQGHLRQVAPKGLFVNNEGCPSARNGWLLPPEKCWAACMKIRPGGQASSAGLRCEKFNIRIEAAV